MNAKIETPLGNALRSHRAECLWCEADAAQAVFNDQSRCPVYRDLAVRATAQRQRWNGPTAQYTWLSIREAVTV